MTSFVQRSFAGGEVAPAIYGRADQAKYATGLRTCRNFLVQRFGGVTNRAGFEFIAEAKDGAGTRLRKFVFNSSQTYVLEFGNLMMRVIQNGVQLEGSPGVPYELTTPYAMANLDGIQSVQSGDVVTLVSRSYAPRLLSRSGHTAWAIAAATFAPSINAPSSFGGTKGAAGSGTYRYKVTSVKAETYEESLAAAGTTKTITGATQANPCVISSTAHGFSDGDEIEISGVVGMVELNGGTYVVANKTADSFELSGIDSTGFTAYASGGNAIRRWIAITAAAAPTSSAPHVLTWGTVSGAVQYNVYKELNGVYGFIGIAEGTSFHDINYIPDVSDTPPPSRNPFPSVGNYPQSVTYFQQRLVLASTANDPEKVWMSRSGNFYNFTTSSPVQDDDAVTFTLAGRQVNEVRHLLEIGKLIILTSGGELTAEGDTDGVIRPQAINPRQQGYNGAASLAPIPVSNSALYLQARGSVVRDLRFNLETNGYSGSDLTIFASHLFDGHQLIAWDYAQIPHSVVWAVRDDGVLLSLTYLREQEIWGWARHDTDGRFLDVVVVPEDDEDVVYVLVARVIGGVNRYFIERQASRRVEAPEESRFLDSFLTYDGRNTGTATMTLSGTGWLYTDTLTLTASASAFSAGDVGNAVRLRSGDDEVVATITVYTSGTVVSVKPNKTVPASLHATATAEWALMVDQVTIAHLAGRTVGILADGMVQAQRAADSGGVVTLDRPAAVIHVGLPYVSDLETLDVDDPNGKTLVPRRKNVAKVTVLLEGSRGGAAGPDFAHLTEWKQRRTEGYADPVAPFTGPMEVRVGTTWDQHGRVAIRQSDPLPITVLAITPTGEIGGE